MRVHPGAARGRAAPWLTAAQAAPDLHFQAPVSFDSGEAQPSDVESADFNNDGVQDLAVLTKQGGGKINLLLGTSAGQLLLDNTVVVAYASGLASGDFNGDGILDLAVTQTANKVSADICGLTPSTVILRGLGGTPALFTDGRSGRPDPICLPGPGAYLNDVVVADFDGDGHPDLAVADNGAKGVRVYLGAGDGTFPTPPKNAAGAANLRVSGPFATLDLNGDGHLDLVAGLTGGGGVVTFLGDGTGLLVFASVANAGSSALYQNLGVLSFAMADVNNDSYADIGGVVRGRADATSSPQNFFFVSLGNAGGIYAPLAEAHLLPGANAGSVAVRDFDKDGALDFVVADPDDNALHVYRGVGDGTFLDGPVLPSGVRPTLAVTGDVNADNWGDIVGVDNPTTGDNARAWVIRQQPGTGDATGPTVTLIVPAAGAVVQGPAVAVAAAAIDGGSGVSRVDFFGSNGLIGSATSPPYSVGWDASRWRNGPCTLTARAYDRFENLKTSPGVPVSVANPDTVPPEVDLAPLAGPILSGVVALSATATDANGVGRVEFYRGTTLIGTDASAPSPFTLSWDTATVPAGMYALTAKAYDTAVPPNVATSSPVTVTVDQPPSAAASGPASVVAFTAAGATVPLIGSGTDPDLGDELSYRWTEGVLELGTTPVVSPVAALGPHLFTLTVTDSFGLSGAADVAVAVLDTTSPIVAAPPPISVAATQALGATGNVPTSAASNLVLGFLSGATAHDDVDPLSVVALPPQAPLGPEGVFTDVDATTRFPVGTTPVTFRFTDSSQNVGSATASITVAPPIGGAVQAAGEAVVATDATDAPQPVTVRFTEVQQPGLLTAVVLLPPEAPPLPEGIAFASPVFDVVTTALVSPPFLVCLQGNYDETSLLAHFENNEWRGLMPEPGSSPGELCGLAESLSPFAAVKAALATQTITFDPLSDKTFGDPPFPVTATTESGLAVSFSIASGPATVDGNIVTITGAGVVTVRASQAGDDTYGPALDVDQSFTVGAAAQTITFGPLANRTFGDPPFGVAGTSSSGLSVAFSIFSGPATIDGSIVTITGVGTVVVRTTQPGNGNHAAAPDVEQSFTIEAAAQTITFGPLADKTFGDAPFGVSATASSGLPVAFSIVSGPATIDGSIITITGAGMVTVRASQVGNGNYGAAPTVERSFTVAAAIQTITFGALTNKRLGDPPFIVSATASSGLPVTFSIASGPATIDENLVTITGAGPVTVRASQAGNGNYRPAPDEPLVHRRPRRPDDHLCAPRQQEARRPAVQRERHRVVRPARHLQRRFGPGDRRRQPGHHHGRGHGDGPCFASGRQHVRARPRRESLVHRRLRGADDHLRFPHQQADQRSAFHRERHRVVRPARDLQHRLRSCHHRRQPDHHHGHGHGDRPGLASR